MQSPAGNGRGSSQAAAAARGDDDGPSFADPCVSRNPPKRSPVRLARLKMLQSAINTRNCDIRDRMADSGEASPRSEYRMQELQGSLKDMLAVMGPLGGLTAPKDVGEPARKHRWLNPGARTGDGGGTGTIIEDRGYYRLSDRIGAYYTLLARALTLDQVSSVTKKELQSPVRLMKTSAGSPSFKAVCPALEHALAPGGGCLVGEAVAGDEDLQEANEASPRETLSVYVEGSRAFARRLDNSQGIFRAPSPTRPLKQSSSTTAVKRARTQFSLDLDEPRLPSPSSQLRLQLEPVEASPRTFEIEKKRYLSTMEAYWKQVDRYAAVARTAPMQPERPHRILRRLQIPQPNGLDPDGLREFDERSEAMIADIFQDVYADYYEAVARSMLSYDIRDENTCLKMKIYPPFLRAAQKWWFDETYQSRAWRVSRETGVDHQRVEAARSRLQQCLYAVNVVTFALQEQWNRDCPPSEEVASSRFEAAFARILFVDLASGGFLAGLPKTINQFVDAVARRAELVKDCLKTCWVPSAAKLVNDCIGQLRTANRAIKNGGSPNKAASRSPGSSPKRQGAKAAFLASQMGDDFSVGSSSMRL